MTTTPNTPRDEGDGSFCSCQPIDDETGERDLLPGSWEQHLADRIREWLLSDDVIDQAATAHCRQLGCHCEIPAPDEIAEARTILTAALDQGDQQP